jgi:hypothetical protein
LQKKPWTVSGESAQELLSARFFKYIPVGLNADTFLQTLESELLDASEYADTSGITEKLGKLTLAIVALEEANTDDDLRRFLDVSGAYELAAYLLGTSSYWLMGRPKSILVGQLHGWREWMIGANLRDTVVGMLLAEAHRSRAQRRRRKFTEMVAAQLRTKANKLDVAVAGRRSIRLGPAEGSRQFDYVIERDGVPLVAVVDIFQTRAGGKTTRHIPKSPRPCLSSPGHSTLIAL